MTPRTRTREEAIADFWLKCRKLDTGCWMWTASRSGGYGKIKIFGKLSWAHRIAYELTKGPIPEKTEVMHICNHPWCINPDHLQLGTHADNMRHHGESGHHHEGSKTHCKNGHELSGSNVRIYGNGWRRCLVCVEMRSA